MAKDRVIYLTTNRDLYRVRANGGAAEAAPLGLERYVGHYLTDGVRAVLVDRSDASRLYAGTGTAGVLRSIDGGTTWHEANNGLTYKDIWSLAQHPKTGALYAGTEPAMVFRSTDGGETWEGLWSFRTLPETKEWTFPMPPHVAHVRHIAVRADDRQDLFCSIEDGWLVRSRDGGQNWRQIRAGVHIDAHAIAFMPDDRSTVFASTGFFGYRSTDGGETFVDARDGMDVGYMSGVVVHPDRPQVLLTAAANPPGMWFNPVGRGAQTKVFRSEDQGQRWGRVGAGLPEELRPGTWAIAGDDADRDYAVLGLTDGSLWATTDGGDSFGKLAHVEAVIRGALVAHA